MSARRECLARVPRADPGCELAAEQTRSERTASACHSLSRIDKIRSR